MNKRNLLIRCLSGLALGCFFIVAIFFLRPLFYIALYSIATLMLLEWYNITKTSIYHNLIGLLAIPIPIASLLLISYIDQTGWLLMTFFCIVWSVDVMAMFGGKLIGGPKLAPKTSPNKTISGLVIGVLSAIISVNILTLISGYTLPYMIDKSNISLSFFALVIGVIAQISDLSVSLIKRKFKIKDTGTIIPGHGGALDRFDSIILTAPLIALYLINRV
ncbi:Phosphatidate cytidylyltransferase [Candidatus Megaera venefica]|jgi:phosphatidate cytidylyltransferase|uniref:Phosphatidate cytidylyltransferase n=1 Tax=Candidatus Megaera venefica TaxID=2055910 RepID=A0ABU5NBY6_9RICK|nr:phosphatidate cytidylyltransferase [Candidatus Megaera venefica]MEA0970642.1 Phosphatidate cytidylyltransferase [Candidatus Megaera venefica]